MTTAIRPCDFSTGNQPCCHFLAHDEGFGGNLHECFGPYRGHKRIAGTDSCGARVSNCERCHYDHHEGGWDACPAPEIDRTPPAGELR